MIWEMQLFGVKVFLLLVVLDNSQSKLNFGSDNVCFMKETFTERSYIVTQEPKTVKTKAKCWNIFKLFSCEKTIVIYEDRREPRIVTKNRLVTQCCLGYREEDSECVPVCSYGCENGKCLGPDFCFCDTGYYGTSCKKECPEGRWGKSCVNNCNCSENGRCDRISGCVCQPGWEGEMCESQCEDGFYGHLCKEKCNCNGQSCNHKTGECKTITETQTTTIEPPITTSTIEVMSTQLFTTTYDTVKRNDNKDKTLTSETLTENSRKGVSKETHLNIGKSTTTSKISGPENLEISHFTTDSLITTDVRTTENETVIKLISSDEKEEVTVTSTTEVKELVSELPVNFTSRINFENASDEPIFNKTNLKVNWVENEVISDVDLPVITENPDQLQTKAINNISGSEMFDEAKMNINKSWINLIGTVQVDKNETGSLILERNESLSQETVFKWLHFLPTLSVLPAVSFLIIIIAAMWVLMKHRRKAKMVVVVSENNRVFQCEERVKFQSENGFWVNNCTVNPVFLSDLDLNNTPPVLETFKPLNNDKRLYNR